MLTALRRTFLLVMIALFALSFVACGDDETTTEPKVETGIPADPAAFAVPTLTHNNVRPLASFESTGGNVVKLTMPAPLDNAFNPLPLAYNPQDPQSSSILVFEDGLPQGIKVSDVAARARAATFDLVFVFDNSGSMGAEADSVALGAAEYVRYLASKGIAVNVGVVGLSGGVNGGINLGTPADAIAFLESGSGTGRTRGFAGADATTLEGLAPSYYTGGENLITGIRFADDNYNWTTGVPRAYVGFTDEPTQPRSMEAWGTDTFCTDWLADPTKGNVHIVWSGSNDPTASYYPNGPGARLSQEDPFELAKCTGGTTFTIPTNAEGLDLTSLPISTSLVGTKIIEFISGDASQAHNVEIVVRSGDYDGKTLYEAIEY